ncbi:MAG: AbrB/MazE/SpoVT family DNA-binding domain-containing protein [Candidatus Methanosuratincola sp.]
MPAAYRKKYGLREGDYVGIQGDS